MYINLLHYFQFRKIFALEYLANDKSASEPSKDDSIEHFCNLSLGDLRHGIVVLAIFLGNCLTSLLERFLIEVLTIACLFECGLAQLAELILGDGTRISGIVLFPVRIYGFLEHADL